MQGNFDGYQQQQPQQFQPQQSQLQQFQPQHQQQAYEQGYYNPNFPPGTQLPPFYPNAIGTQLQETQPWDGTYGPQPPLIIAPSQQQPQPYQTYPLQNVPRS